MNATKVKIYKQLLRDICNKYVRAEKYINEKIKEICSHEKLSVEEVVYFLKGLCFCSSCPVVRFFSLKIVSWYEI